MKSPTARLLRDTTDSALQTWIYQPAKQRRCRVFMLLLATFLVSSAMWTYYSLMVVAYDEQPAFESADDAPKIPLVDPGKSLIPEKIWQILFKDDDCDPEDLRETKSWLARNMNYQYTLMGKARSDAFVRTHYADEPEVIEVYDALWNTGMKSDLLRYLILNIEGGVYADIDTVALKPIDKWVPPYLRDRIRLVAGIEFDRLDGPKWVGMPHYVQFGQWTFAGAPGHPVFRKLIDRAVQGVQDLAKAHGVSIQELRPNKHTDVVNTTGPIAFTDMILEEIQKFNPTINDTEQLSPMTENVVVGDMLLLPIDAFGMGQRHSGSTKDGSIPKNALVQHQFWGHWGKGDQMGDDHKEPAEEGGAKGEGDKKEDGKTDGKKEDEKKEDEKKEDGKKEDEKKEDGKKEDNKEDESKKEEDDNADGENEDDSVGGNGDGDGNDQDNDHDG